MAAVVYFKLGIGGVSSAFLFRRRLWKNTHFNLAISHSVNKQGNIEQGLLISFVGKSNEGSLHSFRTLTDNDR